MDNYEKKYKEALERAREALNEIPLESYGARKIIIDAFPELAESEDERMIKWLHYLIEIAYTTDLAWDISKDDTLAWLEKQKEQEHPDGCFTCDEYKKGYEAGRLHGFTAGYNKAMKEQKPDSLTKYVYSKEDKKFIQDCANILVANDYTASAERLLSMFEQKPAEWSEEDERMLNELITIMDGGKVTSGTYLSEYVAWLKSLRPSWKPSEEQMEALKFVNEYIFLKDSSKRLWLKTLYEDLKKL